MRINSNGGRAQWYDRNPLTKVSSYRASGVAPHVTTTRATYTVPAGKKAMIGAGYTSMTRDGAATTAAFAEAYLQVTASSGVGLVLDAVMVGNAVGTQSISSGVSNIVGQAGDVWRLITYDSCADGTVAYTQAITYVEFDA